MTKQAVRLFIRSYLWFLYRPILNKYRNSKKKKFVRLQTDRLDDMTPSGSKMNKIFYFGITAHSNLGDMAQYYCIHTWILKNYPDAELQEFEADVVVDSRFGFMEKFKSLYRKQDLIIFQSGYTTQDLGGVHEYMHRLVIDTMPYANILMLPQTIFFKEEANKQRTALSYNKAEHMLFLARDMVSYDMAKKLFPDVEVLAYPDIVTTLIGTFSFNTTRKGVCMCCRNDGEKYYSDKELCELKDRIKKEKPVYTTDTTIKASYKKIRKDIKGFIECEIEKYSKFEVMITDRYHGTIFSVAAGTPVIIIKTNDHKVITGADWFKGIYDEYVYIAESMDDAYEIYKMLCNKEFSHTLVPYFNLAYYSKLKGLMDNLISK